MLKLGGCCVNDGRVEILCWGFVWGLGWVSVLEILGLGFRWWWLMSGWDGEEERNEIERKKIFYCVDILF